MVRPSDSGSRHTSLKFRLGQLCGSHSLSCFPVSSQEHVVERDLLRVRGLDHDPNGRSTSAMS